jgi:hypothetical protein
MQKKEIVNNLIEAFAHANLLLSIARNGEIELTRVSNGIAIKVLSEAAANYMEEINDTQEGQIAMRVINNLMSNDQSIDDIIFVTPDSIDCDDGTLSYEVVRRQSDSKPTLH